MKVVFLDDGLPCAIQRTLIQISAWHMLVGCVMLNRTTRAQARKALVDLFEIAPQPESLLSAREETITKAIERCGLGNRRTVGLKRMTEDWAIGIPVDKLRHCVTYAKQSYAIFALRCAVDPCDISDVELRRYADLKLGPYGKCTFKLNT